MKKLCRRCDKIKPITKFRRIEVPNSPLKSISEECKKCER